MAITKLMHIKERKQGNPSAGLYACIRYILNEEKTEHQIWVGGNCGTEAQEIYETMMDTKRDFEKLDGRQGYHFVLSFTKGEGSEGQVYQITKEFCEAYLGDAYDYVFAVHNDKEHLHAHICFNSVSRLTGYKYRYVKGDWEKQIQPMADQICEKHGLMKLQFQEERTGKQYGEYLAEKEGRMTWKKIIQMDIDYAISRSGTMEEFVDRLKQEGYQIRYGTWKKMETYLTFYAPGAKHGRRDRSLGTGYRYAEIKKRIQLQEKHRQMPPIVKTVKKGKLCSRLQSRYQIRKVKKLYRIRYFHYLNPYAVNQNTVRKQLLHINFLSAEVGVILKYGIRSVEDAEAVYQELCMENRQSGKSGLGSEELTARQKYQALRKQVEKKTMDDHQMEMILDQMEELERQYPSGLLMAQEGKANQNSDVKVLRRMIREERKEKEAALEMQKKGAACPRKNQNQGRIR